MGTGTAGNHRQKTQIQAGKDERHIWTDGMTWHDRHESIIDICEYFEYHRITEKYHSARGTIEQ